MLKTRFRDKSAKKLNFPGTQQQETRGLKLIIFKNIMLKT
jgi:hypothetical protein